MSSSLMGSSTLQLSIIIVCFNHSALTLQSLESIYRFTKGISFEIIIVDNASSDTTLGDIKRRFLQTYIIENQENLGFARANNQAIRVARGDFILLLNNDTYITEDVFSSLINYLDGNPRIDMLGPKLLNSDGTQQMEGSWLGEWQYRRAIPARVNFIKGAAMFIRRSAVQKIGLLDEQYRFYNEDLDYCYRFRKTGLTVVFHPDHKIYHIGGGSSKEPTVLATEGAYQGSIYFVRKHYGVIFATIYRLLVMAEIIGKIAVNIKNAKRRELYRSVLTKVYQDWSGL